MRPPRVLRYPIIKRATESDSFGALYLQYSTRFVPPLVTASTGHSSSSLNIVLRALSLRFIIYTSPGGYGPLGAQTAAAMTVNVFAVPVFFIVFRETIEVAIIVSVLLAFLKQTLDGPNADVVVYKKLVRQVGEMSRRGL